VLWLPLWLPAWVPVKPEECVLWLFEPVKPEWLLPWTFDLSESTRGSALLAMLEECGPAVVVCPVVVCPAL